jgi:hypothetical protein
LKENTHIVVLVITATALIAILGFSIGVAFGATFNGVAFLNTFIPVIAAVGNWVAGIGALAAVFTTLWLAERQRRAEKESVKLSIEERISIPGNEARLVIRVVGLSNKTMNLLSFSIKSTNNEQAMLITSFETGSDILPKFIPYGCVAYYFLPEVISGIVKKYIETDSQNNYKNLILMAHSSIGTYKVKFEESAIKHIKQSE